MNRSKVAVLSHLSMPTRPEIATQNLVTSPCVSRGIPSDLIMITINLFYHQGSVHGRDPFQTHLTHTIPLCLGTAFTSLS
jgi:hypothetical protein